MSGPIQGVATSIAAFIGWAPKGATDQAKLVLSWSEYDSLFGGLDARSVLGYSVSQFFLNGGQQAYIIRLTAGNAATASATVGEAPNQITFTAVNAGDWANDYGVAIQAQSPDSPRFQVRVVYVPPGSSNEVTVETFEDVSVISPDPQGRFVEDVINAGSSIVTASVVAGTVQPPGDTTLPSPKLAGGAPGDTLNPNTAAFETALNASGADAGGVLLLDQVDLFNLLCVPGESETSILSSLQQFCQAHRAFLIADSDPTITNYSSLTSGPQIPGNNAAFYFPWVQAPDPLDQNRPRSFPPCGFVAGIYARIDANHGVWKAPAGVEATLTGVIGPAVALNDQENGVLNAVAVNCIRNFNNAHGTVVWGGRTVEGGDQTGSQWKYIPVRRMALMIEESLFRGLKWVVFEPNDEPLWAQIRLNVGAFMQTLFRQGAFQGATPRDAYFVKCDSETTTIADQNNGIVNILAGFAPLKPAEFVIIQIQQMAGGASSG